MIESERELTTRVVLQRPSDTESCHASEDEPQEALQLKAITPCAEERPREFQRSNDYAISKVTLTTLSPQETFSINDDLCVSFISHL